MKSKKEDISYSKETLARLTIIYALVVFGITFLFSISAYFSFGILLDKFVKSDIKQEAKYLQRSILKKNDYYYTNWFSFSDEAIAFFDKNGNIITASKNFPLKTINNLEPGLHKALIKNKKFMYIMDRLKTGDSFVVMRNIDKFEYIKTKLLISFLLSLFLMSFIIAIFGFFIAKNIYKSIETLMERLYTMSLMLSHEIKTPLTIINTNISLLEESFDKNYLNRIKRAIRRLNEVITNVVFIAKIIDKNQNKREFSLEDLIEKVVSEFFPLIKEKKLDIFIDVEDVNIYSIWEYFEIIITNLLDNAIKYTENGGIKIISKRDKKYLIISIIDTGIGIKKENINKVLNEFFKERDKKGFGLGLFIVSKIVNNLKGKLEIISEENKGTTINIYIPLKEVLK